MAPEKKNSGKSAEKRSLPEKPPDLQEELSPGQSGFRVVGVGASAGGLEALEQFFKNMPPDSGMAFVIIQHLDPSARSSMPEILARFTKMPIQVAREGLKVESNSIYLIPAGKNIGIKDGVLTLEELDYPRGLRLPVDFFFRSLAKEKGADAICIVLSGTGSDGSLGLKAVKAELGTVFVQDPESARYDGMPRSALETGLADFVLAPEQMPQKLIQFVQHSDSNGLGVIQLSKPAEEPMQKIYSILRIKTGHDFSHYKQATISRRLQRRMSVNQINDIGQYASFLKASEDEVKALLRDILISVTNFFRDPEAFESLKAQLKTTLANRAQDSEFRAWVAGCATGEEVYSIAILIFECLAELDKRLTVQVFGTDIDLEGLQTARAGLYTPNIAADITPERLRRYFAKERESYRIRKEIRETVTFAPQNFIKDPPFSRMDLICCRNLLIYLEGDIQKRILPLLHYALKPGGLLFLGTSETVGESGDLFEVADKKWKIYRRRETAVPVERLKFPIASRPGPLERGAQPTAIPTEAKIAELSEKAFLNDFAPAFAVIDGRHRLVYVGGRTGKFLEVPSGQPSLSILDLAREGLRSELASGIYRAVSEKKKIVLEGVNVKYNGGFETISLTVAPLSQAGLPEGLLIIVFQEAGAKVESSKISTAAKTRKQVSDLQGELKLNKENLQSAIEELEATNEELKSANEELQSNNEELQSTNEELDTSREELQSLNEELTTVNAELQDKNELLSKANDDLKNFLNRTDIAIIFLDEDLRIRSYTPTISEIYNIRGIDIGRPLGELTSLLAYERVVSDAREILRTLQAKEVEVQRKDGAWYKMRILPYLTAQNEVNGLVVSFLDINQQKMGVEDLRQARDYMENLFDHANAPIIVWNPKLEITRFNHAFERLTGFKAADVLGKRLDILIPWEARDQALKKIYSTFEGGKHWEAVEIPIQDLEGGIHIVLWNSATLFDEDGKTAVATIAQGQDITERKKAEEEQVRLAKESAERLNELQSVLDSAPFAIWICRDPECRMINGNLFASQLFGVEKGANVSLSAAPGQAVVNYRVMRDEVEVKPEELPAQAAVSGGKAVMPQELEFVFEDGRRVFMLVGAVPLFNADGSARGAVTVGTDISQRKRDEAEMLHLASFPEQNPLPIAELENDGKVKYMNPAMRRLFPGIDAAGAGHAFLKDWDRLVTLLKTGKGQSISREVRVGEAWYLQTLSATPSGAFRIYAQDISESKKTEQIKDDFIGMVSHELRTPLTVVSSAVKTALDDRVTQEDRLQLLLEANSAAESLAGILENLLELSRQQAGRLNLSKEMTNLSEVVQNTSLRLLQQYPARRVLLDMPPELPTIMLDPNRLELVLHNLIENAFKYSREESEVRISARRGSKEIVIGVSDRGEGISPADQRKLFEPFGRLDAATKTKGIGLGLVVCKRLVEAHGGRIWVESAPGVGSTFYFSIPEG